MALGFQPHLLTPGRAVFRILDSASASAAPTIADPANPKGDPTNASGASGSATAAGCRIRLPAPWRPAGRGTLRLYNTAGSGTITLSYLRMRGWCASDGLFMPVGTGTDANKGKINVANSFTFGEVGSDLILHTEPFLYVGDFDWLHAELGAIAGQADSGAGALTIDVVAAAKTYTRGSGSFVTDGFLAGQTVTTSGFTNSGNNGTHVIATVTATVMTMTSATGLVNESGNGNERVADQAVPLFTLDLIVPVYEGNQP